MMATARTYATAGAFRRALEERLNNLSRAEQVDIKQLIGFQKIVHIGFIIRFPAFKMVESMITDAVTCIFNLLKHVGVLPHVVTNAKKCSLCIILP